MYIKVKVKTSAKKELFEQVSEDVFAAQVREKAERNMANKKVLELTAHHFAVPVKGVRIVSGHHHPSKLLSVDI